MGTAAPTLVSAASLYTCSACFCELQTLQFPSPVTAATVSMSTASSHFGEHSFTADTRAPVSVSVASLLTLQPPLWCVELHCAHHSSHFGKCSFRHQSTTAAAKVSFVVHVQIDRHWISKCDHSAYKIHVHEDLNVFAQRVKCMCNFCENLCLMGTVH